MDEVDTINSGTSKELVVRWLKGSFEKRRQYDQNVVTQKIGGEGFG